jgi:hypothetical protein
MSTPIIDAQARHTLMIARLILWAESQGYQVTWGDAYRDPRCPYGNPKSAHHRRLAVDLNLFRDGKYLTRTEDHLPLGEYWERMGGTWGGRFLDENGRSYDGNHYELRFPLPAGVAALEEWNGDRS